MFTRRHATLGQQIFPDGDVPVLDLGETPVHVALLGIRLHRGEHAVEVSGVSLILPVVAENVGGREFGDAHHRTQ